MNHCRPSASWLVALAVGFSGCAPAGQNPDGPDLRAEVVAPGDPDQPGPYAVGITTILLHGVEDQRDIPVEVWYPAAADAGAGLETTSYDVFGVQLAASGYRDVAPDPTAPSFLIAFSHGLGGVRIQNYSMAERLASFGFIVVAPDHPGTTAQDLVLNFGSLTDPIYHRPGTVVAAVDALYDGAVEGLVPRDGGYGLIGHSLGAFTSMYVAGAALDFDAYNDACAVGDPSGVCGLVGELAPTEWQLAHMPAQDDRVKTTILQAPAGYFALQPSTLADMPDPFLMAGDKDDLGYKYGALPMFPLVAPGAAMAVYTDAGHDAPTDICDIPLASALAPDCGDGFADPDALRAITVRHVVAWMGAHLGGQASFEADLAPGDGYTWETK